eukprot:5631895-Lingulodinium_polyedra.AAC.1
MEGEAAVAVVAEAAQDSADEEEEPGSARSGTGAQAPGARVRVLEGEAQWQRVPEHERSVGKPPGAAE